MARANHGREGSSHGFSCLVGDRQSFVIDAMIVQPPSGVEVIKDYSLHLALMIDHNSFLRPDLESDPHFAPRRTFHRNAHLGTGAKHDGGQCYTHMWPRCRDHQRRCLGRLLSADQDMRGYPR